jgi:hypothetical protein
MNITWDVSITLMIKNTTRVIPYAKTKEVHPAQIRNWVRRGILPAIVIGRTILLDAEECDRVLEQFKRHSKLQQR